MAIERFSDALILLGSYNTSGDSNSIKLQQKVDVLEKMCFGYTEHRYLSGLRSLDVEGGGYVNFDDTVPTLKSVDYQLNHIAFGVQSPFTVAAETTNGAPAWLGKAIEESYGFNLINTDLGKFDLKMRANEHTRGKLILPLSSRSGVSGTGAVHQLGALTATQKMLTALHVTVLTGTTMTMLLKSSAAADMVGATTRATFTAATGATSQLITVAGPVTDQYWFATFTFTGTSFTAAVSAGVR